MDCLTYDGGPTDGSGINSAVSALAAQGSALRPGPRYLFDHPQPGISVARSGMALAPCRMHDPGGVAAGPGGVDGPLIGTRPPACWVGLFVTWMPAARRQTPSTGPTVSRGDR